MNTGPIRSLKIFAYRQEKLAEQFQTRERR